MHNIMCSHHTMILWLCLGWKGQLICCVTGGREGGRGGRGGEGGREGGMTVIHINMYVQ